MHTILDVAIYNFTELNEKVCDFKERTLYWTNDFLYPSLPYKKCSSPMFEVVDER
jgi:hypothetical protein